MEKANHDGKTPYPLQKANPVRLGTLSSVNHSERDLRRLIPGKKRAPSNDSRLERARGDLKEGRAGEGNFGKMLSSPESCYTMWSPCTMKAHVAPLLLPLLRPAGGGVKSLCQHPRAFSPSQP